MTFDFTPQPAKDTSWHRLLIRLGLARDNKRDERIQKAAEANRPFHEAEARRALSQPGVTQEAVEKAARVLGRLGKGEG